MRRFLYLLAAFISIVLLVASVAGCVRSFMWTDVFRNGDSYHFHALANGHGRILYLFISRLDPKERIFPVTFDHQVRPPADDVKSAQWLVTNTMDFAGFSYGTGSRVPYRGWAFIIPYWFLITVFAGVPVVLFRALIRGHRASQLGHCAQCGYDLRATPDRCPECGHVPGIVK